jgi:hypothetical protein
VSSVLGVDGIPDFDALMSRKQDHEVQLSAYDMLALGGDDLRLAAPQVAQDQPGAAARAAVGWDLRGTLRAG